MDGILDSLSHDFCGESSSHVDIHRNIANAGSIDGIAVSIVATGLMHLA